MHPWGGLFRAFGGEGAKLPLPQREIACSRKTCDVLKSMEKIPALQELMRRYVEHYSPVSLRDAQTFFGLPQKTLTPFLEHWARDAFSYGEQTYFTAGQTLEENAQMPQVLFLAGFDQYYLVMQGGQSDFASSVTIKNIYNKR
jgi:hypothetical protein